METSRPEHGDPVAHFDEWFGDAVRAGLPEPNAMVLATSSAEGRPGARTVLLKDHGIQGFTFYTNYGSRKGRELADNPRACLVFPWHPMSRQVIVDGAVERLSTADSDDYFQGRPHGSQLGAWASERQSAVVESRVVLDERYAALAERWPAGTPVPRPELWGGFRVVPECVEFWEGRSNRMHDRLRYRRPERSGSWVLERLAP